MPRVLYTPHTSTCRALDVGPQQNNDLNHPILKGSFDPIWTVQFGQIFTITRHAHKGIAHPAAEMQPPLG